MEQSFNFGVTNKMLAVVTDGKPMPYEQPKLYKNDASFFYSDFMCLSIKL